MIDLMSGAVIAVSGTGVVCALMYAVAALNAATYRTNNNNNNNNNNDDSDSDSGSESVEGPASGRPVAGGARVPEQRPPGADLIKAAHGSEEFIPGGLQ